MKQLLLLLVVACVAAFAHDVYKRHASQDPPPARIAPVREPVIEPDEWRPPPREATVAGPALAGGGCDGRTRCTQMRSCSDAKAQMNCPGATMDGDHDGIPCERQWCQ